MQWSPFVLFRCCLLFSWPKLLAYANRIPGGELSERSQTFRNESNPDQGAAVKANSGKGLAIHQHHPIGFLWPLAGTLGVDLELHYGKLDQACHHLTQTKKNLFRQFNLTNQNRLQLQLGEEQACASRLEDSLSLETKHRRERGILQGVWQGLGEILGLEDEKEDYVALEANQLELQSRINQLSAQAQHHLRVLSKGQGKLAQAQAVLGFQELAQGIRQTKDHFRIAVLALKTGQLPGGVISELKTQLRPKIQKTTTQATLNSVLQTPWTPTTISEQSELWQRLWSGPIPMRVQANQQSGILKISIRLPQVRVNKPFQIRTTTRAVILPNTDVADAEKKLELWEIQSNRVFSNISQKPFVDFPRSTLDQCLKINNDFFCTGVQEFHEHSGSCVEALWNQDREQIAERCIIRRQFAPRLAIPINVGEWILQCHQPEPAAIIGSSIERSQTMWCTPQPQRVSLQSNQMLKLTGLTIHGAPTKAQNRALTIQVPMTQQWQWQPLLPEDFPNVPLNIHQHPLQSLVQSRAQEQERKTNNIWLYTMLAFMSVTALTLGILLVKILSCTLKAKREQQEQQTKTDP